MIYCTGDCHGEYNKFSTKRFKEGKKLTKDDYMIVCGDFGIWNGDREENYWMEWLNTRPYTVLFVDGNHENFDRLNAMPVEIWNGGKVHRIRENVIHLMRGQVFTLEEKKFFTFGGASSHDISDGIIDPETDKDWKKIAAFYQMCGKRMFRVKGISWWPEELPSEAEMAEGVKNLKAHDYKIDYVISHCLPQSIAAMFGFFGGDRLTNYFDSLVGKLKFEEWFAGHYHKDEFGCLDHCRYRILYNDIVRVV